MFFCQHVIILHHVRNGKRLWFDQSGQTNFQKVRQIVLSFSFCKKLNMRFVSGLNQSQTHSLDESRSYAQVFGTRNYLMTHTRIEDNELKGSQGWTTQSRLHTRTVEKVRAINYGNHII